MKVVLAFDMGEAYVEELRAAFPEVDFCVAYTEREQVREASKKSNEALRQMGASIQWVETYVADEKTFCVSLADNEELIHKHAEISGFPATKVTEIRKIIDPTTEQAV